VVPALPAGTGAVTAGAMSAAAERYLRLLAEAELRRDGAEDRLSAAADALVLAGAIDSATAAAVVSEYTAARGLRGRPPFAGRMIRPLRRPSRPSPWPYPDELWVVPVGVTLPGRYQPLHVLTLTLARGHAAVLTVAGLIDAASRPARDQLPLGPYGPSDHDLGLTFTGDDGTRYPHKMIGGGTSDGAWWRQDLVLPAAAADAGRWLDIATTDGSVSARVNLPDDRHAGRPEREPPTVAAEATEGGWLLDSIATAQLWLALWCPEPDPDSPAAGRQSLLEASADAIQGAGLVPARTAARRRYAALSRRLGLARRLGAAGPTGPEPDDLPVAWADVLARRGLDDGREAVYPAAAVLPPLDGAWFAVTGLVAAATSATLRVLTWGWAPDNAQLLNTLPFCWWARDDGGHWHVGRPFGTDLGQLVTALDVVLVPPLHPAVTTLEVIVTGRGGTVRATVSLAAS
jgi:hypothetical protein